MVILSTPRAHLVKLDAHVETRALRKLRKRLKLPEGDNLTTSPANMTLAPSVWLI